MVAESFKTTTPKVDIEPGKHSIELAVESNIDKIEYNQSLRDSTVEIFIDTIILEGTEHGGAATCLKCPPGTISKSSSA